ncbi:MAG: hypothetical protein P4L22_02560 [Candidatus Babeliales bacterium]|nr:hypothetical protein [Candidatus Babeliales bacterium]
MKKINVFYILILVSGIFNISGFDCDNDRDCRGFGGNYLCNNRNQCELTSNDEFFGKKTCSTDPLERKLDLN